MIFFRFRYRTTFFSILVGLVAAGLFSATLFVFANPPSSPYAPGATTDPSCSPGDTNCTVVAAVPYTGATAALDLGAQNLLTSGTVTFSGFSTNGGLLYTNASGVVAQTGAGTSTTILHGGTTPSYSAVSLTADVSGVLPVANGGTNASVASITAFNNITGYSAAGATGTTSTNLVFSTSPTLVTPTLGAASATSINGLTITSSTGTLTITDAKTFSSTNTLTLSGTDGSTLNIGSGGTLGSNAYTSTAYAPLASPTFTGTVTIPTPFTLGAVSVTATGTQLNYLASATGTTGTTSTNLVFSTSPSITTPTLAGSLTFSNFSTNGGLLYTNASGVVAQTGAGTSTTVLHGGTAPSYGAVALGTDTSGNYVASVATTSPLSGGSAGSAGAALTLTIADAAADGTTKGAATFNSTNFSASSGVINTIQGISTAATPQFTRLGIGAAASSTNLLTFTQAAASSGSPSALVLTGGAHTGLTASTEATDINLNLARTVQFATGSLTTQRAVLLQAPTYAFAGLSALTTAVTMEISGAPVAGTNATITNAYGLRVNAGQATAIPLVVKGAMSQSANLTQWQDSTGISLASVSSAGLGSFTGLTASGTITFPMLISNGGLLYTTGGVLSQSFAAIVATSGTILKVTAPLATDIPLVAKGVISQSANLQQWQDSLGTALASISASGDLAVSPSARTTGSPTLLTVTGPAHTTLTASTEATDINFNLARTVQFSTGALATQRAFLIQAPTYAFSGSSTLTTAVTMEISGAPVAGTNATITNAYGLRVNAGQATAIPLVVKGASSQSASLQEWQNSSGTVLAKIDSAGAATLAKVNGLTVSTSTGTLTIADGKTLTASNTLTFAGTDGTTMTFPGTSDTVAGLGTEQTWTAKNIFNVASTITASLNASLSDIEVSAATTTITGTTTITRLGKVTFNRPTITSAEAVTVNDAATLYISNSPLAAGSVTLGNTWSIYVLNGNVYFPGTANTIGTVTSGTWNGSVISSTYGGTGVNNGGRTITLNTGNITLAPPSGGATVTLANNFTTSGDFALTLTQTGTTSVTLPTSGTLYGTATDSIASSALLASLSDETGTGAAVFGTSPTFTTSLTSPIVIGGAGTTSDLILRTTSGAGTTGAFMLFQTGNNGATEAMRIADDGKIGIGNVTPDRTMEVNGTVHVSNEDANWTTSNWGKRIELETAGVIQWLKGAGTISRGIGVTTDDRLRFLRSTADDGSAIATTDFIVDGAGSVVLGPLAALATNATDGFMHIPTSAGAPSGTPNLYTGKVPMELDTTNHRLYYYRSSAWHYIAETAGFQIPNYETNDPVTGEPIEEEDFVLGMINKTMEDGALHGIWVRWQTVKEQLIKELQESGGLTSAGVIGDGSVSGVSDGFVGSVQSALAKLGISIQNGLISFQSLMVDFFSAKTAHIERLEMVDQATGHIYCTWIENGEWKKVQASCDNVNVVNNSSNPNPPAQESGVGNEDNSSAASSSESESQPSDQSSSEESVDQSTQESVDHSSQENEQESQSQSQDKPQEQTVSGEESETIPAQVEPSNDSGESSSENTSSGSSVENP